MQELREEWSDVRGFSDYIVSNYGELYSWKTQTLMTPFLTSLGYVRIILRDNGFRYPKFIHRLVAEVFVPGWDDGLEVNHIDGNKLNNHESNLEWVTHSENAKHAYRLGLKVPIKKKVMINNTGEIFDSITECAIFLGTHQGTISSVLTGQWGSWKGYTFSYVE